MVLMGNIVTDNQVLIILIRDVIELSANSPFPFLSWIYRTKNKEQMVGRDILLSMKAEWQQVFAVECQLDLEGVNKMPVLSCVVLWNKLYIHFSLDPFIFSYF